MSGKKKSSKLSNLAGFIVFCLIMAMAFGNPKVIKSITGTGKANAGTVHTTGSLAAFQKCVISRESSGNPSVWNRQGYPYWGLYQFGKPLWDSNGGNPSDWGKSYTSSSEQTQVFYNVMNHYRGCQNWYPSDGCAFPSNGC